MSAGPTGCSPDDITILDSSDNEFTSQGSWIAVCRGRRHQCSRLGASVSCTAEGDSAGGEGTAPAGVVAPAATTPAEAPAERRAALAAALATGNRSILACFPEQQTVEMTLLISPQGAVYDIRATVPLSRAERDCLEHAFMWFRAPRESTPASVRLRFPIEVSALRTPRPTTPPAATGDAEPAPTTAPSADSPELRARLDTQREAILACAERATVVVVARWDASGAVTLALGGELAGSSNEGCVRSAVGAQHVTASAPGELRHLVR